VKNEVVVVSLDNIDAKVTAHGIGIKKVFITGDQCDSNITQVAFGELKMYEKIENHLHTTMDEFYFFIEGQATFIIDSNDFSCPAGTFVKVPAGALHGLEAISTINFIYWGVAILK